MTVGHIFIHSITPAQPSNANRDDLGQCKTSTFGGKVRARYSPQSRVAAIRPKLGKELKARGKGTRTTDLKGELTAAIVAAEPSLTVADAETLAADVVAGLTGSKAKNSAVSKLEKAKTEWEKANADLAAATEAMEVSDGADDKCKTALDKAERAVTTATSRLEDAEAGAEKDGALWFVSDAQVRAVATAALSADRDALKKIGVSGKKFDAKSKEYALIVGALTAGNSLDIAAFGRMYAALPSSNVDAAVQVAHSLGVNEFVPDTDFFTAFDERKGIAAMMDYNYLSSPIMYSYSAIDVKSLAENFGTEVTDPDFVEALTVLVKLLATTMPEGRETKAGTVSKPSTVYMTAGDGGGILSAAFIRTVEDDATAMQRLVRTAEGYAKGYGHLNAAEALWTLREDEVPSSHSAATVESVDAVVAAVVAAATGV